ncbi:phospholipid carrier-dependent glycosyltransferase [Krasilnikovia sp. MM14-A1004]|uniref:phospholipid carrier-dependent glycosyltransferase n=1 Tax=Krasilnikovia sp. MM14-A1004 TaxID=3373541 RepID=UPI00399CFF8F
MTQQTTVEHPADAPPATGGARRRRWPFVLAAVALLAQMAIAMLTTAVQQTPTIDEPVYVGTAVVYQQQHSLRYNPEHPPLGKLLIGAGLAFVHPRLAAPAPRDTQEDLGRTLLYASGNDPYRLMLAGRLPVIVLTLLFGLVVLAFATDLSGRWGGLLALALYAFSPDVIAHGSLATLDVPVAGFLLTAAWLLWRARRRPRLHLPLAGLALGAAVATKMSALVAVPVMLALAALSVWPALRRGPDAAAGPAADPPAADPPAADPPATDSPAPDLRRRVLHAAAAAAVVAVCALAVVWASYLAVDPRLRWVTPPDVPPIGGLRGLVADWLPVPPAYRDGMRIQFGFEDDTYRGFLFGRQYRGALWYYLPAALLVKTPLGMLALWAAGSLRMVVTRRLWRAAAYVVLPATVLLLAAMSGARDFGTRYAVFLPLFLAVAAGTLVTLRRPRWVPAVAAALVVFVAASSLRTFPYYLPYSNEAFGGPDKTYLRLHDSNVDWGQDLGRLADRLRERYPGEPVWLVYKGSGVPAAYGITAGNPLSVPPAQVRGLLVVSDSRIDRPGRALQALIDSSRPVDEVGHSITIFRRPA